ncbi:hypothetical protein Save01_03289 [Streptomyces avermitilis]
MLSRRRRTERAVRGQRSPGRGSRRAGTCRPGATQASHRSACPWPHQHDHESIVRIPGQPDHQLDLLRSKALDPRVSRGELQRPFLNHSKVPAVSADSGRQEPHALGLRQRRGDTLRHPAWAHPEPKELRHRPQHSVHRAVLAIPDEGLSPSAPCRQRHADQPVPEPHQILETWVRPRQDSFITPGQVESQTVRVVPLGVHRPTQAAYSAQVRRRLRIQAELLVHHHPCHSRRAGHRRSLSMKDHERPNGPDRPVTYHMPVSHTDE